MQYTVCVHTTLMCVIWHCGGANHPNERITLCSVNNIPHLYSGTKITELLLMKYLQFKCLILLMCEATSLQLIFYLAFVQPISLCNSCNTSIRDLLDMCVQSLRALGPRAKGMHIRLIVNAHVIAIASLLNCYQWVQVYTQL